jgi:hypothetical protein
MAGSGYRRDCQPCNRGEQHTEHDDGTPARSDSCPRCGGLATTRQHRGGEYEDRPNGLEAAGMCELYAPGSSFWNRRLSDSEAWIEQEAAR